MKARGINLGNWLDNGEGSNYVIDTSSMIDIMDEAQINNGETSWIGIPLTEEWLKRFGFEYSDLNGDSGLWKISPLLRNYW